MDDARVMRRIRRSEGGRRVKIVLVAGIAALAGSMLVVPPASGQLEQASSVDKDAPGRIELRPCTDATELDCIESIGLVTSDGVIPGAQVSPTFPVVTGPVRIGGSVTGPVGGRVIDYSGGDWRIPGLRTESGADTIDPFVTISTPGLRWYDATTRQSWDVPAQILIELISTSGVEVPADPPCNPNGTCGRQSIVYPDQTFRVVVRTSWFDPSWGRTHLGDTKLSVRALPGGGSRITMQGHALDSPGFFMGGGRNPNVNEREQIDYYDYRWLVYLMDANDPRFPEQCSRYGFPLISGNQWGTGTPQWYPNAQRLSLNMSAPHFAPDGSEFRGHYEAFIPARYAQCLWKADPKRLTNQLMVEVTAQDGQEKAATTSIAFRDGGVRIIAEDFTFSSPRITVQPKSKRR